MRAAVSCLYGMTLLPHVLLSLAQFCGTFTVFTVEQAIFWEHNLFISVCDIIPRKRVFSVLTASV